MTFSLVRVERDWEQEVQLWRPRDPRHHTQKMKARLEEIIAHLREEISKLDEPKFQAMFETPAEVLGGLKKAFDDYEQRASLESLGPVPRPILRTAFRL